MILDACAWYGSSAPSHLIAMPWPPTDSKRESTPHTPSMCTTIFLRASGIELVHLISGIRMQNPHPLWPCLNFFIPPPRSPLSQPRYLQHPIRAIPPNYSHLHSFYPHDNTNRIRLVLTSHRLGINTPLLPDSITLQLPRSSTTST